MLFDPEIWFFQTTGISMFQVQTFLIVVSLGCFVFAAWSARNPVRAFRSIAAAFALWMLVTLIRSL